MQTEMNLNKDVNEQFKKLIDEFGKLSFLLETWAKLKQTGDCKKLADEALDAAHLSCASLLNQIEDLNPKANETDNI